MAITTIYRGLEFRSRLEARYAAFFTRLGWHYTYEPFDGEGYIPDFLIHGDRPLLVEIKPAVTEKDYRAPIDKLVAGVSGIWHHDALILGADPLPRFDFSSLPPAGLMGEYVAGDEWNPEGSWMWDRAEWFQCGACGETSLSHEVMTYTGRPCGHHDGDHYLNQPNVAWLRTIWADATNDVKWRGRAA